MTENCIGGWHVTQDAILNRYQEIADRLGVTPPPFSIVSKEKLNGFVGEHRHDRNGSFSISISESVNDAVAVDIVLVHELSHHVLHLSGYQGTGHAWPMLAIERILFLKLGWEFDSIISDAKRNWPRHTVWNTWLRNVEHAYFLYDEIKKNSSVESTSALELGSWVLSNAPQHEPKLFECEIGKKFREMHHSFIADRRAVQFVWRWIMQGLLLGGFGLVILGSMTNIGWLNTIGGAAMVFGFLAAAFTGWFIIVWQKCRLAWSFVQNIIRFR